MKMDLIIEALLEGDLAKATTLKDAGMDKFISFEGLSKNGRINLGCGECIEHVRNLETEYSSQYRHRKPNS